MTQAHAKVQWGSTSDDSRTVFGFGETEAAAILDSYKAQNALAKKMGKREEDVKRLGTEVK